MPDIQESRAIKKPVKAGTRATCPWTHPTKKDANVTFRAKAKLEEVVANVYKDGIWQRVEHWHPECYKEANNPYGVPTPSLV